MVGFYDLRASLAEAVQLPLQTGRQDTDQAADDEDAAQGDREHRNQIGPRALVAAHRAGIQRAHQRLPHELGQFDIGGQACQLNRQGNHDDDAERGEGQQPDQGGRAAGEDVVEPVAQPFTE